MREKLKNVQLRFFKSSACASENIPFPGKNMSFFDNIKEASNAMLDYDNYLGIEVRYPTENPHAVGIVEYVEIEYTWFKDFNVKIINPPAKEKD